MRSTGWRSALSGAFTVTGILIIAPTLGPLRALAAGIALGLGEHFMFEKQSTHKE